MLPSHYSSSYPSFLSAFRIYQTRWTPQKSPTSWACIRWETATGTSRRPVQRAATVCTKVSTGYPTSWRTLTVKLCVCLCASGRQTGKWGGADEDVREKAASASEEAARCWWWWWGIEKITRRTSSNCERARLRQARKVESESEKTVTIVKAPLIIEIGEWNQQIKVAK